MDTDETRLDLQSHLETVRGHIDLGQRRIEDFYGHRDLDYDEADTEPLDRPPHQLLIEDGSQLICNAAAINVEPETGRRPDRADLSIEHLLRGVGTEILLGGIHLKLETDSYLEHLRNSDGNSPSFWASKEVLEDNLGEKIDDDSVDRLGTILDIIKKHRNNHVHLGFHESGHSEFDLVAYETLKHLIEHYSENSLEAVEILESCVEELEQQNTGLSFPSVEFNVDGN
jgi:hypothetical protein